MAQKVKIFSLELRKTLGIEIEEIDETLTTWEARKILSYKKSNCKKENNLDSLSAKIILEDFLSR